MECEKHNSDHKKTQTSASDIHIQNFQMSTLHIFVIYSIRQLIAHDQFMARCLRASQHEFKWF